MNYKRDDEETSVVSGISKIDRTSIIMKKHIEINELKIEYELTRMNRKTLAIHLDEEGMLVVKAPKMMSDKFIMDFINSKQEWIFKRYQKAKFVQKNRIVLCEGATVPFKNGEIVIDNVEKTRKWLIEEARYEFIEKATQYSKIMGVEFNRIYIREQKTRWGSCSTKKNLNFNWKLIMMPEVILDYVVVHELAHLIEMNHSQNFWNQVKVICPQYKECRKWLKTNGGRYM